jgi:hypothetical protein
MCEGVESMAPKIGLAAVIVATLNLAGAALAQEIQGVTVLRGNTVTSDGTHIGVGNGGADVAPTSAANSFDQSGNVNAVRTGSANAGGEIANPPPGFGR